PELLRKYKIADYARVEYKNAICGRAEYIEIQMCLIVRCAVSDCPQKRQLRHYLQHIGLDILGYSWHNWLSNRNGLVPPVEPLWLLLVEVCPPAPDEFF
ncbi:MAG: hypothetical protein QME81_20920, partial [bacterium]|nr:hypothetical protein [bacterium]